MEALNEKNMDFCTNKINVRYPIEGYCSNLEVEELCYVLEGKGTIYKRESESIDFKKGYEVGEKLKEMFD